MVLHSLLQIVQPEYGQLERRKLQLPLFAIFVEDCPELDLKTSLLSRCLGSPSNTQPSILWTSNLLASVAQSQPTFFFPSFQWVLCSIERYRMKSNNFLLIWSVVTPENNTGIRQFR